MDREKTWRFDLYKMGANSYGSVRPFGGKPQPLRELKGLRVFIDYSIREGPNGTWMAIRNEQGKDSACVGQMSFSTFEEAVGHVEKWKKADNRAETCDPMRSYESMPDYA